MGRVGVITLTVFFLSLRSIENMWSCGAKYASNERCQGYAIRSNLSEAEQYLTRKDQPVTGEPIGRSRNAFLQST
jgi:hypothetical protein